jgi:putative sigma-54 modulation protein
VVQISIAARHGHLSDATQAKVSARVEKLARYFERLTAIEVVVDLENELEPEVEVKVSAEHKHDFVAKDKADSLLGALDGAVHKAEQQLRKYKEKVQERHRQPGNRRSESLPEPESE